MITMLLTFKLASVENRMNGRGCFHYQTDSIGEDELVASDLTTLQLSLWLICANCSLSSPECRYIVNGDRGSMSLCILHVIAQDSV